MRSYCCDGISSCGDAHQKEATARIDIPIERPVVPYRKPWVEQEIGIVRFCLPPIRANPFYFPNRSHRMIVADARRQCHADTHYGATVAQSRTRWRLGNYRLRIRLHTREG